MQAVFHKIFFLLYELVYLIIFGFIKIYSLFSKDMQNHLNDRMRLHQSKWSNQTEESVLFFISSAGEYEQALPLADKLEKDFHIVFIFFSPSGIQFAHKRKEKRLMFLAAPDFSWIWSRFFQTFNVKHVFIVRHELWPNFIRMAAKYSQLHLVDASLTSESMSYKLYLRLLAPYFTNIFTVSLYDQNIYRHLLPNANVVLTGDTKYDRAEQRKSQNREQISIITKTLRKNFAGKTFLVVGSAWPKDVELILKSWELLGPPQRGKWQVVIAPHDISPNMLESIEKLVTSHGMISCRFDAVENLEAPPDAIAIVDRIGILFDLYGCAHAAFVGGAMHHKIHNVLEPAIFGCHIAHGPRYHNQKESRWLVEKGFARAVESPEQFADWLNQLPDGPNELMLKGIQSLMGATNQVFKTLKFKS